MNMGMNRGPNIGYKHGVQTGVQTKVKERERNGQIHDLAGLKFFALIITHSLKHSLTSLSNPRGAFVPKNIK